MNRARRWLAVAVVLIAVPAILATSPEPDPVVEQRQKVAIDRLDASTPARSYTITAEVTGARDRRVVLAFGTRTADGPSAAVRVTRTSLDGSGPASVEEIDRNGASTPLESLAHEGGDGQVVELGRCSGTCTFRGHVTVELVDPVGAAWEGEAVVLVGMRNTEDGAVELDVRPTDDAPATPLEARLVDEFDLLSEPTGGAGRGAVALEVSGPADAVRRARFLVDEGPPGRRTVVALSTGTPASTRGARWTGIADPAACAGGGATCTSRTVLVVPHEDDDPCQLSSIRPQHLTVSWLVDPIAGVDVSLVPVSWVPVVIDHDREPQGSQPGRPAPLPLGAPIEVPPGSTLLAQARAPGFQDYGCSFPETGLIARTSTGEAVEPERASGLRPIETCPADAAAPCTAWVDLALPEDWSHGEIDAVLVGP